MKFCQDHDRFVWNSVRVKSRLQSSVRVRYTVGEDQGWAWQNFIRKVAQKKPVVSGREQPRCRHQADFRSWATSTVTSSARRTPTLTASSPSATPRYPPADFFFCNLSYEILADYPSHFVWNSVRLSFFTLQAKQNSLVWKYIEYRKPRKACCCSGILLQRHRDLKESWFILSSN